MTKLDKAIHDYEAFRGFAPADTVTVNLPDKPLVGWHMGQVTGLAYRTERDGEIQDYMHEFKTKARPDLVVEEPGNKLHLIDGNYCVTDRGIEDFKVPPMLIVNPHKRGTKPKRKANPMAKRRRKASTKRRSSAKTIIVRANPVAPLRKRKRRHVARTSAVSRMRRRRNPIRRGGGGRGNLDIMGLFGPALLQGAGAVVTSVVTGFIPAKYRAGSMAGAANAVVGLALGWGVSKFVSKKIGQGLAEGALTIAVYNAVKGLVPKNFAMGEFIDTDQLGEFIDTDQLGFYSPAMVAQDVDYGSLYGTMAQGSYA